MWSKRSQVRFLVLPFLAAVSLLAACAQLPFGRPAEEAGIVKEELVFAPPLAGVSAFAETRAPAEQFANYLSEATGLAIRAFVPTDYGNTLLGLKRGEYDIVYLPAALYVKAHTELGVLPGFHVMSGGKSTEKGVILVRADSGLETLAGLEGKKIAAFEPDSAAGWVLPAAALKQAGVDPLMDADVRFEASDADSIVKVLQGDANAAFARAAALEDKKVLEADPEAGTKLKALAEFEDASIGLIAFRKGLTKAQLDKIKAALQQIESSGATGKAAEGNEVPLLALFGWDGLAPAKDDDFKDVQNAAQALGMVPAGK